MMLSACGLMTGRFAVLRKTRISNMAGAAGHVKEDVLAPELDGEFVELPVSKEEFAGQIRLARTGTLTLMDTVGVRPDDRIRDLNGTIWEIGAFAVRGESWKELVLKEAVHG